MTAPRPLASLERLVRPLEGPFQEIVDAVLARRGAPTTRRPAELGAAVAALSKAYNSAAVGEGRRAPMEARVGFSFARDVPKGAAAVRELVAAGALAVPSDRPLTIVDLGAGAGAMTWGVVRALEAAGAKGRVEALLVDDDPEALAAAEELAREAAARRAAGGEATALALSVRTRRASLGAGMHLPPSDLVVMGQVLSEIDLGLDPEARAARHAALLRELLAATETLVVVEPALRERTRHLHAVRDRLAAGGQAIFAPCLHAAPCPALAVEGEWCHEDLAVDLPEWLVPVARAAGLRWQGLTFSYLALRRDGATLAGALPAPPRGAVRLRVISGRLASKGKLEVFGCTDAGARARLRRLDRHASEATAAWDELERGDVVTLSPGSGDAPPVDDRGRLDAHAGVDVWRG